MRTYEIGTEYEFIVDYFYTTTNDFGQEKRWLALNDGETARKYNVPAYPCQRTGYEGKVIICTVTDIISDTGYPFLLQKRADVLSMCYKKGEIYWFTVGDKKEDSYSGKPYYELIDRRNNNIRHRFYCNQDDDLNGVLPFVVKDIESNHLNIDRAEVDSEGEEDKINELNNLEAEYNPFGHEDAYHEWKSSLVFPPDSIDQENPDVEKQVRNIMKSIAGFQNAEGGLLYIGITNEGKVRGISADFDHLNEGDDSMKLYSKNTDGFENKIRNAVNNYLGKNSLDNISFKFYRQQSTKRIFCIITISKTDRPVYMDRRDVFKRYGNGVRTLKGDEITEMVISKYNDASEQIDFPVTMPKDCLEFNPNINVETTEESSRLVTLDQGFIKRVDYYYMTFYRNNHFMYSKESHASDDNVITEVRFNRYDGNLEYSRDILVKCTEDGFAKLVQAAELCKLGSPGTSISLSTDQVFTIKVAHKYDFLKLDFNDGQNDREKYIRLTSLFGDNTESELKANNVDVKYQFRLKGRQMIPTGYKLKNVEVIRECLPDSIQFVSANNGSIGKGSIKGEPIADTANY